MYSHHKSYRVAHTDEQQLLSAYGLADHSHSDFEAMEIVQAMKTVRGMEKDW